MCRRVRPNSRRVSHKSGTCCKKVAVRRVAGNLEHDNRVNVRNNRAVWILMKTVNTNRGDAVDAVGGGRDNPPAQGWNARGPLMVTVKW